MVPGWSPVAMNKLSFPAVLLYSNDDPYCTPERARQFAAAWGAEPVDAGPRGHLNADSGLGDWAEAFEQLSRLQALPASLQHKHS
jgi:predicted alpha/beta hydrolase family esterase